MPSMGTWHNLLGASSQQNVAALVWFENVCCTLCPTSHPVTSPLPCLGKVCQPQNKCTHLSQQPILHSCSILQQSKIHFPSHRGIFISVMLQMGKMMCAEVKCKAVHVFSSCPGLCRELHLSKEKDLLALICVNSQLLLTPALAASLSTVERVCLQLCFPLRLLPASCTCTNSHSIFHTKFNCPELVCYTPFKVSHWFPVLNT